MTAGKKKHPKDYRGKCTEIMLAGSNHIERGYGTYLLFEFIRSCAARGVTDLVLWADYKKLAWWLKRGLTLSNPEFFSNTIDVMNDAVFLRTSPQNPMYKLEPTATPIDSQASPKSPRTSKRLSLKRKHSEMMATAFDFFRTTVCNAGESETEMPTGNDLYD